MPESPSNSDVKSVADVESFLSDDKIDVPEVKPIKEDKEIKEDKGVEEKEEIDLKEDLDDEDKLDLEDDDKEEKDEDEESEEDEDDVEIEIESPPRKKEITGKYPKFFKDFPWMEKMMFRDRQYSELFGSFDDAKEAHHSAQLLNEFRTDLGNGDLEKTLNAVKRLDSKAFDRVVDNYLVTLARVDKDAYLEVAGTVGKTIIEQMHREARESNDEELGKFAAFLNKYLFGTTKYTPHKPRVEKGAKDDENEELKREREKFTTERFQAVQTDIQTRVDNTLRNTISTYIDPKNEMTPYIKKNAINDALKNLHASVRSDSAFVKVLDKLWEGTFAANFSQDTQRRILSAYLGKSKGLLPTILKKARAEALKGLSPSARRAENDEEEPTPRKREPIQSGRPRQSSGKNEMKKGESVLDFLSRD